MDQPVIPFDLTRMLIGDAPPLFLLEILVRTTLIYLYALAMVRWIGGRSVSQLSLVEFLLVIALGSAVGDGPLYPDTPLLHAFAVITCVVLVDKGLDRLIRRSDRIKQLIDGRPVQLVDAGRLLVEGLAKRNIGPAETIAGLRRAGIRNLGEVDCAFMEANGSFSVFKADRPLPGLPIVPPAEVAPLPRLTDPASVTEACCTRCGARHPPAVLPDGPCPDCDGRSWTAATTLAGNAKS